jgi:hypothetical protein
MFKRPNNAATTPKSAKPAAPPPPAVAGKAPGNVMPPGKQAYEARRAAKAGVSLDRWMADKQKRAQAELEAARRERAKAEPPKKPGLLKRLLDRAHKPL